MTSPNVRCVRVVPARKATKLGAGLMVALAIALSACKESPPPRVYKTIDDYLTHPDACIANTAKHIKASGRPWPNEEYPESSGSSQIMIFDLWAGDRLYRIDTRKLNIFNYGGLKLENDPPLKYGVLKESLTRLAGESWVKERGLPSDADAFGVRNCRNSKDIAEEIQFISQGLDFKRGKPVHRMVKSSPTGVKEIGVTEWVASEYPEGTEGKSIVPGLYIYEFDDATKQEIHGQRITTLATCYGRLGEHNYRSPRCYMNIWLGPGVYFSLRMEPPAPEHIGEVFNMIVKYLEDNRIQ